ncbi:hypothetical protein PN524_30050, partial [Escherichia coli]|nr:hypothetical protein [Escherichia coli]
MMPERKAFNGLSKGQNRRDLGLLLPHIKHSMRLSDAASSPDMTWSRHIRQYKSKSKTIQQIVHL